MLADGFFEGVYKDERVAISHFGGDLKVYLDSGWEAVRPHEVEVAFTLRRFENGEQVYSAVSDTPSHKDLPKHLPSGWLAVI